MAIEICTNSVSSCIAAQNGGADRVELCAGIPEGGTTPSYGEICTARELLSIKLHVIIRPRGGDFLYSPLEMQTMMRDIELAKKIGVDGVVIGCLTQNGEVNIAQVKELMQVANGLSITFHRAFDVCRNPFIALEQLIDLGCNRILTSGQASTAEAGIATLKELQTKANGRIAIMAGCGINENNIAQIAQETGIKEFHFSARENIKSKMHYKNTAVSMSGTPPTDEYVRYETTSEKVRKVISAYQTSRA